MSTSIDWQDYAPGEHRLTCPNCGRGKRDKTAGLKVESESAVLHCFRCGLIETYREKKHTVRRAPQIQPARDSAAKHTTLSDWGRALWEGTLELSGVAVAYLEHRRCVIPPLYSDLRWHPALKHPSGYTGPALVGLISHIHTNEALSLHRTWIAPTGKADVHPPRLLLGNHAIAGGAIKLWPHEDVSDTLGVCEGIETALSMAHAVQPVWACIDAGHLERFPVLAGLTQLYVGADRDPAGEKAAKACAARWHKAKRLVHVSTQQKNDLNDVLEAA